MMSWFNRTAVAEAGEASGSSAKCLLELHVESIVHIVVHTNIPVGYIGKMLIPGREWVVWFCKCTSTKASYTDNQ